MHKKIEVITYEQDRLNFFVNLMQKAQEKYKRLFKKFKDAPYLSEEAQILSDAGRETHFYGDVVEMLEKGYRKQSENATDTNDGRKSEWISVEDRLPERNGRYLTHCNIEGQSLVCILYYSKVGGFNEGAVTHWMPLPEAPKGDKTDA